MKDFLIRDYRNIYWRLRDGYLTVKNPILKIICYCFLKRIESKCNADMGTSYHDSSAEFEGHPSLPHGLNGIVISRLAKIGHDVTIFHQVTIGINVGGQRIVNTVRLRSSVTM